MKNKLLIALAFLGLGTPAFAQFSDSTETKNHLGIIASPSLNKLFENNRSLPVGLIYKRQIKQDQAWRLSIVGTYQKLLDPKNENLPGFISRDYTSSSWKTLIGYEWQKKLNNRFIFHYGTDAGVSLNKSVLNSEYQDNFDNGQGNQIIRQTIIHHENKTLEYILKPMVGFQFKIHPKLYVATESSIILAHSRTNIKTNGIVDYIT